MFINKSVIATFGILFLLVTSVILLGANHQQKVKWEYATYDQLIIKDGDTYLQVVEPERTLIVKVEERSGRDKGKFWIILNGKKVSFDPGVNPFSKYWEIFRKELAGPTSDVEIYYDSNIYMNAHETKVIEIMGSRGWELVQHIYVQKSQSWDRYIFKRPKNNH